MPQPKASTPIPEHAMRFCAPCTFAVDEAAKTRQVAGVAYDGGIITDHWFWNDRNPLVIDTGALQGAGRVVPINLDHDSTRRIGNARINTEGGRVSLSDGRMYSGAAEIVEQGLAGHPWGQSLGLSHRFTAVPVRAGEQLQVNGRTLTGPFTLARGAYIEHIAITDNPADPQTSATFFSQQQATEVISVPTENDQGAVIAALNTQLAAEKARADKAEAELSAVRLSARKEQAKAMFTAAGQTGTDAEIQPYLDLPEVAFEAIKLQFAKFAKPAASTPAAPVTPPAHLFSGVVPGAPAAVGSEEDQLVARIAALA